MDRNLDTEAAIIINDLKSLTLRIDGLEANPSYTSASWCVGRAIICMASGRSNARETQRCAQDEAMAAVNRLAEKTKKARKRRKNRARETPQILNMSVMELDITPRIANAFRNEDIRTVGDLVQKTEQDMVLMPNFGRRSLNELKEVLAAMGLHLGMQEKVS